MSLLQETIAYIWLLPVVAQLVLPLGLLLLWSIKKVITIQFSKNIAPESMVVTELEPSGSVI